MIHVRLLSFAAILFAALPAMAEEAGPPLGTSELLQRFQIKEARQAVGVDADAFYAVDNTSIAKYDKKTGALLAKWEGDANGSAIHLDSAAIVDGKLYAAHSNYPAWPMTSSVEIWDAATLEHIGTHSFGIDRGSLTWLDFKDGVWWGTFANYNRVFDRSTVAYGNKYTTQLVRFGNDWQIAEAWVLPDELLEKFEDMSNSGGSWGPDGKLYLSGHDPAEIYQMEFPKSGSIMNWTATFKADIEGQGIAWDRSQGNVIFGIVRPDKRVTATRVELPKKAASN
jgi:hypothetical protein